MDTHWTLICLSSIEESQGLPNDEIFVLLNDFPTQCGIHLNNRQKYQNVNKSVSLSLLKNNTKKNTTKKA